MSNFFTDKIHAKPFHALLIHEKFTSARSIVTRFSYQYYSSQWDRALKVVKDPVNRDRLYYLAARDIIMHGNTGCYDYKANLAIIAIERYNSFVDVKSILMNEYKFNYQEVEDMIISNIKSVNDALKSKYNISIADRYKNFNFNKDFNYILNN